MLKIGLIGYGKAGQAVANVLGHPPANGSQKESNWTAYRAMAQRRSSADDRPPEWLDTHPVDARWSISPARRRCITDEEVRRRKLMLVTGISAYSDVELAYIPLGDGSSAPLNMTLGINFVILAAKLLREIAPTRTSRPRGALSQQTEVSGTPARSLRPWMSRTKASRRCGSAGLSDTMRSSGFPYQTVRDQP